MSETTLSFQSMGLPEPILKALEQKGYGYPTRVQAEAIGPLMEWRDVIAKAPTGTGKTFAFGIPMICHVNMSDESVQGLILAPTRELAIQIGDELCGLLAFSEGIRVAVLYGGAKLDTQARQLKRHPQIIVATPGRLMDHFKRGNLKLDGIQTVILDEADRMLDMGFFDDVTKILNMIKNRRQLGLFSATISQEVMTVSWMYQRDELEITVQPVAEDRPDIDQYSMSVPALEKEETTRRLLTILGYEKALVFCNTKHMCQRLCDDLRRMGVMSECIHGDIRQQVREKNMNAFRQGAVSVLIATDVASRGIDVDDVELVINYDIPLENEYYVHRIGRTGRAHRKGIAVSIVGSFPEQAKLEEISKYCHFEVQPIAFGADDTLVQAPERKAAPPKRRFR